jgi:hypothetical protein
MVQGMTSNCYVVASATSLAERPELIREIFLTDSFNEVGLYAFKFYVMGKPWIVTIDDYIPFVESNPQNKRLPFIGKLN